MLSSALAIARDDLVGDWPAAGFDPGDTVENFEQDEAKSPFRWSARVRGEVLDHILLAPLDVVAQPPGSDGWVTLWATPPAIAAGAWNKPPGPGGDAELICAMRRPSDDQFRARLADVNNHAILRSERLPEILQQIEDILPFLGMPVELAPARQPFTMELIEAVYRCVVQIEMRFKNALGSRRPGEYLPQIQPMIATPAHSTFPSGHATEAFALAYLLAELSEVRVSKGGTKAAKRQPEIERLLMQHAARIAENRVVAGVHFTVDNEAGATLGLSLGRYLIDRIRAESKKPGSRPPIWSAKDDDLGVFDRIPRSGGGTHMADTWTEARKSQSSGMAKTQTAKGGGAATVAAGESVLGALWDRVAEEWH